MKNLYLGVVFLLVLPLSVFSQGENDNWFFGKYAAVNFSSTGPISVSGSQMSTAEGVASISDASGNLLFYTNGIKIWNKNHNVMVNSCCMAAGGSSVQGVVIVPFPGSPSEYFVFTTNGDGSLNSSTYSKVDMTLNNGLGGVVSLNTPLLDQNGNTVWNNQIENITVTGFAGGYWVLIAYGNDLLAYRVDSSGVNIKPVTSYITPLSSFQSHIKVSPDQNFLTVSDYQEDKFYIYNFDIISGGVISLVDSINTFMYAAAFSTQGDVMWVSDFSGREIYGYDMNMIDLSNPSVVFTTGGVGADPVTTLQRAPDGNIYVSIANSQYLGKISTPNNLTSATFNPQAVYLGGNRCFYGLPQLVEPDVCNMNLTLTGSYIPTSDITYSVSNKITTVDYIVIPDHSEITMDAGNHIELLPNTELSSAEAGSILAVIGGCTDPLPRPITENHKTKINDVPVGNSQKSNIETYPNPVIDLLNIYLPKGAGLKTAAIYNLAGREMKSRLEGNTMDMSGFASGVYILKLETSQGNLTKKVIKK